MVKKASSLKFFEGFPWLQAWTNDTSNLEPGMDFFFQRSQIIRGIWLQCRIDCGKFIQFDGENSLDNILQKTPILSDFDFYQLI